LRKTIFIVLGLVSLAGAIALMIGGIGSLVYFGADGRFESKEGVANSEASVLVSEPQKIETASPLSLSTGTLTIEASSADPARSVFIGIGRAEDVATYLSGVNYATIHDVGNRSFSMVTDPPSGGTRPPADPTSQTFWMARAEGTGVQQLDWSFPDGEYRLVLMHRDGQGPVAVHGRVAVTLPWIFPIAVAVLAVGLVVLVIAISFFATAARIPRKPKVRKNAMIPTEAIGQHGPLPTPLGGSRGPSP
jgi:hypothetical protein